MNAKIKPKTKEELKDKAANINLEKFKEGIQELETKFGFKLEPALYFSKMGVFPQIEVQKIEKPPVKEDKKAV